MTTYQTREAARIAADRAEQLCELDLREQLEVDRKAREMRAENARRAAKAVH